MGIELGTSRIEVKLTRSARELTNFANSCSSVLLFLFIRRQNILTYLTYHRWYLTKYHSQQLQKIKLPD